MTADVLADLRHDLAHETAEVNRLRAVLVAIIGLVETADTACAAGQFSYDVLTGLIADVRAAMPKPGDVR